VPNALEPQPGDGPVLVTLAYRVPEHEQVSFVALMREVERARRRTGAYRWGLFRDLAAPDRFLETYLVESWGEHLRQHVRPTATDQANRDAAEQYSEGRVAVAHYVSASAVHPDDEPAR
jgi:hypothetical protein